MVKIWSQVEFKSLLLTTSVVGTGVKTHGGLST